MPELRQESQGFALGGCQKARIRVHGANQSGNFLEIVSDRDCTIWTSQKIQLEGCHTANPVTKADTGLDHYVIASRTLDLQAGMPAKLELGNPLIVDGPYQNVVAPPKDGAMLFSSGEGWTGYEAPWMMRLQPCG